VEACGGSECRANDATDGPTHTRLFSFRRWNRFDFIIRCARVKEIHLANRRLSEPIPGAIRFVPSPKNAHDALHEPSCALRFREQLCAPEV
jgi:hypothetical protein